MREAPARARLLLGAIARTRLALASLAPLGLALTLAFTGCRAPGGAAPFADDGALRAELAKRMEVDQSVRFELMDAIHAGTPISKELVDRMHAIDAENTAWIEQVLDARGWPPKSALGDDGATAVFLLVQHADQNPDLQRRALPLLEAAVAAGEARPADLALLTDRVRLADGRPQLYGSQVKVQDGKSEPFPIEDEEHVDERRAKMGLPPMAEYLKQFP